MNAGKAFVPHLRLASSVLNPVDVRQALGRDRGKDVVENEEKSSKTASITLRGQQKLWKYGDVQRGEDKNGDRGNAGA